MKITEVKISLRDDEKLKAFATVTLDDCFVIRGMKIIQATRGLFVAMPTRRKPDGSFQDVAHPIHAQARAMLEQAVLGAYQDALREGKTAQTSGHGVLGDADFD
jgi:stage V sporulation protein G